MNDRDPASLQREERKVARKLRSELEPSAELLARVQAALDQAQRAEAEVHTRHRHDRLRKFGRHAFLTLPAVVSVALAVFVNIDNPAFEAMRVAEHHVELTSQGAATVRLKLALHEHEEDQAKVALVVPQGVRITRVRSDEAEVVAPLCERGRCRYEFDHPTESEEAHVHAHVSEPGSYRMEVEHASTDTRVREVVVIHARR